MNWNVDTQGTGPIWGPSFTLEDVERIDKQRKDERRKKLRKMKKAELIEYIISLGK